MSNLFIYIILLALGLEGYADDTHSLLEWYRLSNGGKQILTSIQIPDICVEVVGKGMLCIRFNMLRN